MVQAQKSFLQQPIENPSPKLLPSQRSGQSRGTTDPDVVAVVIELVVDAEVAVVVGGGAVVVVVVEVVVDEPAVDVVGGAAVVVVDEPAVVVVDGSAVEVVD